MLCCQLRFLSDVLDGLSRQARLKDMVEDKCNEWESSKVQVAIRGRSILSRVSTCRRQSQYPILGLMMAGQWSCQHTSLRLVFDGICESVTVEQRGGELGSRSVHSE